MMMTHPFQVNKRTSGSDGVFLYVMNGHYHTGGGLTLNLLNELSAGYYARHRVGLDICLLHSALNYHGYDTMIIIWLFRYFKQIEAYLKLDNKFYCRRDAISYFKYILLPNYNTHTHIHTHETRIYRQNGLRTSSVNLASGIPRMFITRGQLCL